MMARLKMLFIAIVLTSIKRPSASVQMATNPTARAGVLLDERTRRKELPGRPWSRAKAKVSREAATMRMEQLHIEENQRKTRSAMPG